MRRQSGWRWLGLFLGLLLTGCSGASAAQANLDVSLGQPMLLAGKKNTTYLKVGLTGFAMKKKSDRAPVNIALVIDRSGSMSGEKLKQAKVAALKAIDRLSANDILSVVAYDTNVQVLLPATKVTDRTAIRDAIERLEAGSSTALFAGLSKGAAEVRKFYDSNRVNRVILLSDGLANIGPSSPGELGDLGASLRRDGISVTTIGLGLDYNEQLMTQLARRSDGNHAFVENERDLPRIFNYEFGDVLSVVAQKVTVRVKIAAGIRPVRALGRDADITGQTVTCTLNQLYSRQEKYLMLEIEVPTETVDTVRPVASVEVRYANMLTKTTDVLKSDIAVRFTEDTEAIAKAENKAVMVSAVKLVANEQTKLAFALRRAGKIKESQKILTGNINYLDLNRKRYNDKGLEVLQLQNYNWNSTIDQPFDSKDNQRNVKEAYEVEDKMSRQRAW